jgi:predicted  nucleic acid-binding Zn-ribbon protein
MFAKWRTHGLGATVQLCPRCCAVVALQVSELSHKLGSAEGSVRSFEQEVAQLRSQAKALAGDKHELELQLANTRAQLAAAQEKVSTASRLPISSSMQQHAIAGL